MPIVNQEITTIRIQWVGFKSLSVSLAVVTILLFTPTAFQCGRPRHSPRVVVGISQGIFRGKSKHTKIVSFLLRVSGRPGCKGFPVESSESVQHLLGLAAPRFEFTLAFRLLHQKGIVIDRTYGRRINVDPPGGGISMLALIMACE
jgi:hypothetical protein